MYHTVHPAAVPSPKFPLAIPAAQECTVSWGRCGGKGLSLAGSTAGSFFTSSRRCYQEELVGRRGWGQTCISGSHHQLPCLHSPQAASGFCKNSARSLVAFYHNGALPCECHPAGATSHHCSPEGGQCPCRPNVIGRQCTRCAAGYYGFPHCKREWTLPCSCSLP